MASTTTATPLSREAVQSGRTQSNRQGNSQHQGQRQRGGQSNQSGQSTPRIQAALDQLRSALGMSGTQGTQGATNAQGQPQSRSQRRRNRQQGQQGQQGQNQQSQQTQTTDQIDTSRLSRFFTSAEFTAIQARLAANQPLNRQQRRAFIQAIQGSSAAPQQQQQSNRSQRRGQHQQGNARQTRPSNQAITRGAGRQINASGLEQETQRFVLAMLWNKDVARYSDAELRRLVACAAQVVLLITNTTWNLDGLTIEAAVARMRQITQNPQQNSQQNSRRSQNRQPALV